MDLHKWQRDSPAWSRKSGGGRRSRRCFRSVQGGKHSSNAARMRRAQGHREPGGWVPVLCFVIAELPQIFALSYLLPHLQHAPGLCFQSRSSYYSRFPLLKVTPDSTCGRRWELLGTVAFWHTDQHSEELRHRADKVRHGCERCWEWKYQSEFVQSVWILTLIKRGKHKAAPPRLSPTSSAENSFHRACNSYCAPTSPEVEHVAASFICPVHHLMSPR